MYTTSTALLEAVVDAGVTHLFVNLGSDHPSIVEALSKRKQDGNTELRILTMPNEFVGLCAAQGFFQASGKMQAVLIHVDAGTLALAGAVHNVSRARIPVLMIAGTSPITEEGELRGSRNVSTTIISHHSAAQFSPSVGCRNSFTTCKIHRTSVSFVDTPSSTMKFAPAGT